MDRRSRGARIAGLAAALSVAVAAAAVGAVPGVPQPSFLTTDRAGSSASTARGSEDAETKGVEGGSSAPASVTASEVQDTGSRTSSSFTRRRIGPPGENGSTSTSATSATGATSSSTTTPGSVGDGDLDVPGGLRNLADCASAAVGAIRPSPSTTIDDDECPIDFSCLTEVLTALRDADAAPDPAAFANLHECIRQIVDEIVAFVRAAVGRAGERTENGDGTASGSSDDGSSMAAVGVMSCVQSTLRSWAGGPGSPSGSTGELDDCWDPLLRRFGSR